MEGEAVFLSLKYFPNLSPFVICFERERGNILRVFSQVEIKRAVGWGARLGLGSRIPGPVFFSVQPTSLPSATTCARVVSSSETLSPNYRKVSEVTSKGTRWEMFKCPVEIQA